MIVLIKSKVHLATLDIGLSELEGKTMGKNWFSGWESKTMFMEDMTPKKRLDKGNAPMIEEEPSRPKTRSRGTTLVISELVDRPVSRLEEAQTMTSEATNIMSAEDVRESGRVEISDRRDILRTINVSGHDDKMYTMLERMTNIMDEVRNFMERQTRVERSPPRI
ncbi:hypothetical protein ACLOJK_040930 [Asimina triloba]